MANNKDVPQMIRGLSMAMRLLTLLINQVKKYGGNEEMLHFLTTDRGHENLDKVSEFITRLNYAVPVSVLKKKVYDITIKCDNKILALYYMDIFWQPALQELNIPYTRFSKENESSNADSCLWPIPEELEKQLRGKLFFSGLPVTWGGEEYLVTALEHRDAFIKLNETIRVDDIEFLHIAPALYFDTAR